jgi:hypothetical protein
MKRWSATQREKFLAEYAEQAPELSQVKFADSKGIHPTTFSNWVNKRKKKPVPPKLTPVEVLSSPKQPERTTDVEVDLPGEVRIRVRYKGPLSELAGVIEELRRKS